MMLFLTFRQNNPASFGFFHFSKSEEMKAFPVEEVYQQCQKRA